MQKIAIGECILLKFAPLEKIGFICLKLSTFSHSYEHFKDFCTMNENDLC